MGIGINFWFQSARQYQGKVYSYKCRLNDIELDDLVVVDARGELKVVKVVDLNADIRDEKISYKEILCKLPKLANAS